jgi:signal transduction histidine kinase
LSFHLNRRPCLPDVIQARDAERARLARNVHDGAQQRLVQTVITLKRTRRALELGDAGASALVSEALEHAEQANAELRELARGTLPPALAHGGLTTAVEALASCVALPVAVDVSVGRLPEPIEAHAYLIVAEALTNVVKHACASSRSRAGGGQLLTAAPSPRAPANGPAFSPFRSGAGRSPSSSRNMALPNY